MDVVVRGSSPPVRAATGRPHTLARMRTLVQRALIATVAVGTALGLFAIAADEPGLGRVLACLFATAALLALLLVVDALLTTGRKRALAVLTAIAVVLAFAGVILAILARLGRGEGRVVWCLVIAALGLSHVSALYCARLRPRYAWVRSLAVLAVTALGGCLVYHVLDRWRSDEAAWRLLVALALVACAASVLVAVFNGISRRAFVAEEGLTASVTRCPHCGRPFDVTDVFG